MQIVNNLLNTGGRPNRGILIMCKGLKCQWNDPRNAQRAQGAIDRVLDSDALAKSFAKLEPMQQEMTTRKQAMEAAATAKDFVKALELLGELSDKVDAYEEALEEIEERM